MAPGWDRRSAYFEQTAQPVTERMLERLAPRAGETILDLAAGSGAVGLAAAALVGRGGQAIVSDFSEEMVEAAQRNATRIAWRTSSAGCSTPSASPSPTTRLTACCVAGATC